MKNWGAVDAQRPRFEKLNRIVTKQRNADLSATLEGRSVTSKC